MPTSPSPPQKIGIGVSTSTFLHTKSALKNTTGPWTCTNSFSYQNWEPESSLSAAAQVKPVEGDSAEALLMEVELTCPGESYG